jgi:hypothetical protein
MTDTPGAWPATPDDVDVKQTDAARAVRMHVTGSGDRQRTTSMADAAAVIRGIFSRGGK